MEKVLFDFDDILIEPAPVSKINTRSEINIYYSNQNLPLMTAPMDTVISEENLNMFKELKIVPVLPRIPNPGLDYIETSHFLSYSLQDFEKLFLDETILISQNEKVFALIDVANGHMEKLHRSAKFAKEKYGDSLCLMIGNVANPKTFENLCKIGVDFVRIGIGNGNGCLTTVQTGVGYPMASLISECFELKTKNDYKTGIVADGGFKKYSDIIKALALGSDYVMLGSIFNKALQSAGETTKEDGETIDQYSSSAMRMFQLDIPLFKVFRGMSTKDVQKMWGKEDLTTSEGVVRKNEVEYTLDGWVRNFEDYLRSAMSYTGKKELLQFIGGVNYNRITLNSYKRFDK